MQGTVPDDTEEPFAFADRRSIFTSFAFSMSIFTSHHELAVVGGIENIPFAMAQSVMQVFLCPVIVHCLFPFFSPSSDDWSSAPNSPPVIAAEDR